MCRVKLLKFLNTKPTQDIEAKINSALDSISEIGASIKKIEYVCGNEFLYCSILYELKNE